MLEAAEFVQIPRHLSLIIEFIFGLKMQENLFWSEKNVECCDSPAI
jgi:hypothetical protein